MTAKRPTKRSRAELDRIVAEARSCTHCAKHLPHAPRPILRASADARVVLIGQAPGAKVHESGIAWQDDSGRHLCSWLGVSDDYFAESTKFAVIPMGFCFPGRRAGGDLPPRAECAPLWHERILTETGDSRLVLLIGQYAIDYYLSASKKRTLTDTVRAFREYLPEHLPLPHPSWRSRLWMKKNPWFETELLPELRRLVRAALR